MKTTASSAVKNFGNKAILTGTAFAAVSLVSLVLAPKQFFASYLTAFMYWISIPAGSLGLLLIHQLTGGEWGKAIRPLIRQAVRSFPFFLLLFLPLVFGMKHLYEWADPAKVAHHPLLQHKAPYLNAPSFIFRALLYFGIWTGLAAWINRWTDDPDKHVPSKLPLVSGLGLIASGLAMTFASVDWVMSLTPEWFSTIYGLIVIVGQILASLAFFVIASFFISRKASYEVTPGQFHDLGNLTLAFVMLWAYMSVSQFLIIWSGNLPEEVTWYLARSAGGWQFFAIFLAVMFFAAPFILLLMRSLKREGRQLVKIAFLILFMQFMHILWLIAPAFHPKKLVLHWSHFTLWIGLGGLWIGYYCRGLDKVLSGDKK